MHFFYEKILVLYLEIRKKFVAMHRGMQVLMHVLTRVMNLRFLISYKKK